MQVVLCVSLRHISMCECLLHRGIFGGQRGEKERGGSEVGGMVSAGGSAWWAESLEDTEVPASTQVSQVAQAREWGVLGVDRATW